MDFTDQNSVICTTCKRGKKFKVYFFDKSERKDYVLECDDSGDVPFSYDRSNNICTFNVNDEFDLPFHENENHEIEFPIQIQRELWKVLIDSGFKRIK